MQERDSTFIYIKNYIKKKKRELDLTAQESDLHAFY